VGEGERGAVRSTREDIASLRIDRGARRRAPRRRGPLLAAVGALLLVVAGLVAWRLFGERPAVVEVGFAQRSESGALAAGPVLTGSGYVVTGERYISLGVRVPGRIVEYRVEEGQSVEAGDVLVRLDDRNYLATLREGEAALALARANLELRRKELVRQRELLSRDVSSQAQLDVKENEARVAEAEVQRAEALLAQRKVDVEDTVLRAPTSGVILEKLKEVGEIAVPGGFAGSGELIRMASLEEMRAEVDVNEADMPRVRMGQPVEVVPDAYPDKRYSATVVKMYPQVNRQKGTLKVEVRITDPDAALKPDMSVRLNFLEAPKPAEAGGAAVSVPRAAVREDAGGAYVWVVTDGRLRRQAVQLAGPSGADRMAVASGLSGGEAVVVASSEAELSEGRAVETGAGR
jgi:RND family efflux transporter MFP subunit